MPGSKGTGCDIRLCKYPFRNPILIIKARKIIYKNPLRNPIPIIKAPKLTSKGAEETSSNQAYGEEGLRPRPTRKKLVNGNFRKLRAPKLGVPIKRIRAFKVLY